MSAAISPRDLYAVLGLQAAPAVADIRPHVADDLGRFIPSAVRVGATELLAWAATIAPDRAIVVYCTDGGQLSVDAARALRTRGIAAYQLEGGMAAWVVSAYATVRDRSELNRAGGSRWITRERPKIDRLACPWLVRRFIDPSAQFFYTAAHRVRAEGEQLQAQPFDIADVTFSHRGQQCSFDAFLREFDLRDPVLDDLATIVRGADTGELQIAPQAHGLLAISLGLSANYLDDILLLEHAMVLYDALYAWCKTARAETHSWPKKAPQ